MGPVQDVYLSPDEDSVPGAPLVHSWARNLTIWEKIGVPPRPTAELAIEWLQSLSAKQNLVSDELKRVRALLPRYPNRIWNECGHWLDIENTHGCR